MEIIIKVNAEAAGLLAAGLIAEKIRTNPKTVLGLATGGTPLPVYEELVRLYRQENLDFSSVTTFNLDEYVGLGGEDANSYCRFMWENLFNHINIAPERVHIPNGLAEDMEAHCLEYEDRIQQAGGIDLQLLGIGANGHIGFNEPNSSFASRTRVVNLAPETVKANRRFFPAEEDVPRRAVTMGIGTILESRSCLLLAAGENKAEALAAALEAPVSSSVPASALQSHPRTTVICDRAAAAKLRNRLKNESA